MFLDPVYCQRLNPNAGLFLFFKSQSQRVSCEGTPISFSVVGHCRFVTSRANTKENQMYLGHEHIKAIQVNVHQKYKQETLKQRSAITPEQPATKIGKVHLTNKKAKLD